MPKWKPQSAPGCLWDFCRMAGDDKPATHNYICWGPGQKAPVTQHPYTERTMPTDKTWWTARLGLFDFEEAYQWGIRKFYPWLPWGMKMLNGVLQFPFDNYLDAPKWLKDGFLEAWIPWLETHVDAEVMFYMGHCGPDTNIGKKDGANWFFMANQAMAPIMALHQAYGRRVSMGVDVSALFPKDTELWTLREQYVSMGMEFYCEGMPVTALPHWASGSTVTTWEWFDNRHNNGSVPDEQIIGDVVVISKGGLDTPDLFQKVAAQRLDDGRSFDLISVQVPVMIQQGKKFSELGWRS